jgi:hypothetical protein
METGFSTNPISRMDAASLAVTTLYTVMRELLHRNGGVGNSRLIGHGASRRQLG